MEKKNRIKKVKKVLKKRGRKPKGGKIISSETILKKQNKTVLPNIILHLKCSTKDLNKKNSFSSINYNPKINNIESFNIINQTEYELYDYKPTFEKSGTKEKNSPNIKKTSKKKLSEKIKKLQKILNTNNIANKKSDCFWCTFSFNNHPIHIPARKRTNGYEVYGCFCSPQCAVAFLNKEKIDSSTRWERYSFLNNIYGKFFNYEKNIKPAPNPFYTLGRYYGNLTIHEYRALLNNKFNLMVVNKPLTKILPELHEENYEMQLNYMSIHNTKTNNNVVFSLKRKKTKKPKKNIISENFKNFNFN